MSATAEVRQYTTVSGTTSDMGRSRVTIRCPFCQGLSTAYLWSLAGSGKRCENLDCRAKFSSYGTATARVVGR